MKLFILSIASVFLISGTLWAQPMNDRTFSSQYQLARVYEETHDLTNAIRIYGELHQARPAVTEVSEGLFRGLYALKRYAEAETLLTQRIAAEPPTFDLYLNLARVRTKLNNKAGALEAFAAAGKFAKDAGYYSTSIVVAQTMMEVGYQEEALAMLLEQRKKSEEGDLLTGEIAGLYFKLGKYEEGTKEYLAMLHSNDQNLSYIQQRIALFTADTSLRRQILRVVTSHIDIKKASVAELRLLGWCYGELKDYRGALAIFLKLDDMGITSISRSAGGDELFQFAERVRKEGALDVAVTAYKEAIKRFREGAATDPRRKDFVAMAELGYLETKEAYLRSMPEPPRDSIRRLVSEYQDFSLNRPNELAFNALLHAGELSFKILHDYSAAQGIYELIVSRSPSLTERTRDAYFALEEIALALNDLPTALRRLDKISGLVANRRRPEDAEVVKHILFERARIDYFSGSFDSATAKLDSIIADPNSDYANDAIALHSLISENGGNDAALKLFAKAELQSLGNDVNAALSAYRSIPETYPTATIADESIMRAVDILVQQGKPNDALALLASMQEKMSTSPLLDKATFREAEIVETMIKDKPKAQRMYEDFLERYPKSPLCTEARKRARTLRGDSF
ncbi:MAG: tetratricopeptide repeat protein [Bacteroidota bacterium]|nr:tetratricopeptide repeat protein [Bacteroidota bacterium]MDP4236458.1 tetratricopeptide repeat protein [Bacteroidota bacterium]